MTRAEITRLYLRPCLVCGMRASLSIHDDEKCAAYVNGLIAWRAATEALLRDIANREFGNEDECAAAAIRLFRQMEAP